MRRAAFVMVLLLSMSLHRTLSVPTLLVMMFQGSRSGKIKEGEREIGEGCTAELLFSSMPSPFLVITSWPDRKFLALFPLYEIWLHSSEGNSVTHRDGPL